MGKFVDLVGRTDGLRKPLLSVLLESLLTPIQQWQTGHHRLRGGLKE